MRRDVDVGTLLLAVAHCRYKHVASRVGNSGDGKAMQRLRSRRHGEPSAPVRQLLGEWQLLRPSDVTAQFQNVNRAVLSEGLDIYGLVRVGRRIVSLVDVSGAVHHPLDLCSGPPAKACDECPYV